MTQIMASRKRRTSRWLEEHRRDSFVRRAGAEGYRSRAAYKLAEIDRRDGLLRAGMTVVDLGAAPGSWSQYAAKRVGAVVAVDRLPMQPLPGVTCVKGDFTSSEVQEQIVAALPAGRADLVFSDMAPNISGIAVVDQSASAALAGAALEFCQRVLRPGGTLLVKLFQGPEARPLRRAMEQSFERVSVRKPEASRSGSAEQYLLARGYRPQQEGAR